MVDRAPDADGKKKGKKKGGAAATATATSAATADGCFQPREFALLQWVLTSLHKCFLHDTDGFMTRPGRQAGRQPNMLSLVLYNASFSESAFHFRGL